MDNVPTPPAKRRGVSPLGIVSMVLLVPAVLLVWLASWLFDGFHLITAWVPLGMGLLVALVGLILGGIGMLLAWARRKSGALLPTLATLGCGLCLVFGVYKAAAVIWNVGSFGVEVAVTLASVAAQNEIYYATINNHSTQWTMIEVRYLGSDLPQSPGQASFELTNNGEFDIVAMDGVFHAVHSVDGYVEKPMPVKPVPPLRPGRSLRIDLPLADVGDQVRTICTDGRDFALRYRIDRVTTAEGHQFSFQMGEPVRAQ